MARNGTTNAPNLLRNEPKKRIHTGRGNARRLDSNVGFSVFMENKKPCSLFGEQGLKNLFVRELDVFLLLAGGSFNNREPITATDARRDDNVSVVTHRS